MPQHERMVILYVEDEPDWVILVTEILGSSREPSGVDFIVFNAKNLEEAKDMITKSHVDVIILDLGLPDCKGIDTVREVKAISKNIPVIVVSALKDEVMARQAFNLGIHDFYEKSSNFFRSNFLSTSLIMARERNRLFEKRDALKDIASTMVRKMDEQIDREGGKNDQGTTGKV